MRVLACILLFALLTTTGTGCALFKKNGNNNPGPNGPGAAPPKFPADPLIPNAPPPQFPAGGAAANKNTSILAGTVIDAYHRPIGNAFIRWSSLDEKDGGAPIDVATDANGHFIIQGVKPGESYKLIARTKQGDKLLAGTVLTSAPDVRVVIPIREDLVTGNIPPLPGSPAYQQEKAAQPPKTPDSPGAGLTKPTPKTPDLPATMTLPTGTTPSNVGNPGFVPGVVGGPLRDRPPLLSIPNKPAPTLPTLPNDSKLDTGPTRIPSCALVGSHLENLALKDTRGQTWEYKKQAVGKLVLIDFWGTNCVYCRDSMPHLNRLQSQYGPRGLEVIGIALEPGKDERREAEAVNKVCTSMQVSYRQLLGRSAGFDIASKSNFKIDSMPTLILLSEQGDVIYHHKGRPDPAELSTLERLIKSRLDNRAF